MKRVYSEVAVAAERDGFIVTLDGRPLATPLRTTLRLPCRALADAVAAEWQAQGERVALAAMLLTRIAGTAIDRVEPQRDAVIAGLAAYAETDLLCYRAEEPADLVARQGATWQPLLDWLCLRFDAPLAVTSGVVPLAQPAASLKALSRALQRLDRFRLAALGVAVPAAGSLAIGLALAEGQLSAAEAFAAAELDASYQIELWGEDPIAAQRRAELRAELDAAARFFALLRPMP